MVLSGRSPEVGQREESCNESVTVLLSTKQLLKLSGLTRRFGSVLDQPRRTSANPRKGD